MITKNQVLQYHSIEARAIREIDSKLRSYQGHPIIIELNYPDNLLDKLLIQYREAGWDIKPKHKRRTAGGWDTFGDLVLTWRVK